MSKETIRIPGVRRTPSVRRMTHGFFTFLPFLSAFKRTTRTIFVPFVLVTVVEMLKIVERKLVS